MSQNRLQKLELTWIGKDNEREPIEPRILIENPQYSYGDAESGNMLIHGDNLLALKALEQEYAGRVKCIYIDPPYNTGSAWEHYDDSIEHSEYVHIYQKTNNFKITKRIKEVRDNEFEGYEYYVEELSEGETLKLGNKDCKVFKEGEYRIARLIYKVPNMGDDFLGYRYFLARENEKKKNGHYLQGVPLTRMNSNELPYPSFFDFQAEFNRVGYEGVVSFRNSKKPEALIKLFFKIADVKTGEYVLDSFLGSGTTAAVAQKMGLNWIGIISLLICCTAFQPECKNRYPHITIKKIPQMLLGRCAFGKDDYSLNIIDLPQLDEEEWDDYFEEDSASVAPEETASKERTLFD